MSFGMAEDGIVSDVGDEFWFAVEDIDGDEDGDNGDDDDDGNVGVLYINLYLCILE